MTPFRALALLACCPVAVVADAQVQDYKSRVFGAQLDPESAEYRMLIGRRLHDVYGAMSGEMSFVAKRSNPGESASGVVLQRTQDLISIDMTPCSPKKSVRYFVSPYRESSVSDEKCGEKTHQRVQVIQLGPTR